LPESEKTKKRGLQGGDKHVARGQVANIVLPVPLRGVFDYSYDAADDLRPGTRVKVSFGKREMTGIVIGTSSTSEYSGSKLKAVEEIIDAHPLLDAGFLKFIKWISDYYIHPLGDVMFSVLPTLLRSGKAVALPDNRAWVITEEGRSQLDKGPGRAPVQYEILKSLSASKQPQDDEALRKISANWKNAISSLENKGLVNKTINAEKQKGSVSGSVPRATADQETAITRIVDKLGAYQSFLLFGITGSGKTEVYLRCIAAVVEQSKQALVLVPEIGLTPQLVGRFRDRFNAEIDVLHSGMTDTRRMHAWERARRGISEIIIGTRSAVFAPLARPGIIILDEEHDSSYKQQDGFRYHARDVAIKRASLFSIPVVLGSATPSLESWQNASENRYHLLELRERAKSAGLPNIHLLDMAKLPQESGISTPLRDALRRNSEKGEQSLLFLNRRGYAPALCCQSCNAVVHCQRCDARMTWHKIENRLVCHHCGSVSRWPESCPTCGEHELVCLGQGTENIHEAIEGMVPGAMIERIDRDTTRRKGELEERLQRVHSGKADILVGTQMLSKGHDFPNLTLVGILDSDPLLYSSDFRASERLFQLITQVSGRAGRSDKQGTVLLQTRFPESPWMQAIASHDYRAFADMALEERKAADFPPYSYIALLRAEATTRNLALQFLERMHEQAKVLASDGAYRQNVKISDPVPSAMEKRAGRYRAQLLVQASKRGPLHSFLASWMEVIENDSMARKIRWSLDVDPADLY
jgi:primosomal protein N' (replication factor Y)